MEKMKWKNYLFIGWNDMTERQQAKVISTYLVKAPAAWYTADLLEDDFQAGKYRNVAIKLIINLILVKLVGDASEEAIEEFLINRKIKKFEKEDPDKFKKQYQKHQDFKNSKEKE